MGGNPDIETSPLKEPEILDIKPLRSLAPLFPAPSGFHTLSPPSSRPFVYVTPFGSFSSSSELGQPPSFFPLFTTPASSQQNPDQKPANPAPATNGSPFVHTSPLNGGDGPLFGTPSSAKRPLDVTSEVEGTKVKRPLDVSSEVEGTKVKKAKKKKYKKVHHDVLSITSSHSSIDAKESVDVVLMTFDALRRRISQIFEVEQAAGIPIHRQPHLRAMRIMSSTELRANINVKIGHVPGIEVGDVFYFRVEMHLIGLHTQSVAGIDFKSVRFEDGDDDVALSVVSAGGYENEENDVDVLIYSGQGGGGSGDKRGKKQIDNQKLERGNLALERSLLRGIDIRVVRSEKDPNSPSVKIYIYDGIYEIQRSWVDQGKRHGFDIFKYKLRRKPGQPDGYALWKTIRKWRENPSSRGKVILPDISSGLENMPVILVNDVDNERGPNHFVYATRVDYPNPIASMKTLKGCMCQSSCQPGNGDCCCIQRNGGLLPFSPMGILVCQKPLLYECNASCQCSVNCRNRVTQKGITVRFEVFRTKDRGWGLRSWDPIRAGTFVCEYIGEVIDEIKEEDGEEDEYIFHASKSDDKSFRWNYIPELLGEASCEESSEASKCLPTIISAKRMGNVSRFMNHSCSPNVFWQPIQYDHDDEGYPHIMFFAIKHIPPMTELTYDYGTSVAENGGEEGIRVVSRRMKKCLCGSSNCRGSFWLNSLVRTKEEAAEEPNSISEQLPNLEYEKSL